MDNLINTQQQKVLALLRQMGSLGVNSWDLTFKYHIKQAPTRISELKEKGYEIVSKKVAYNRSRQYILLSGSSIPKQKPTPTPVNTYTPPWQQELVPVKKTFMFLGKEVTRICYEKPENVEKNDIVVQTALF